MEDGEWRMANGEFRWGSGRNSNSIARILTVLAAWLPGCLEAGGPRPCNVVLYSNCVVCCAHVDVVRFDYVYKR